MLRTVLLGGLLLAGAALLLLDDWWTSAPSEGDSSGYGEAGAEGGPTLGVSIGKKPAPDAALREREAARHLMDDLRQMSSQAQAELLHTRGRAKPDAAMPFSEELARLLVRLLCSGDPFQSYQAVGSLQRMGPRAAPLLNEALAGNASLTAKSRSLEIIYRWRLLDRSFPLPDLAPLLDGEDRHLHHSVCQIVLTGVPYEPRLAARLLARLRERPTRDKRGFGSALARMGPQGVAMLVGRTEGEEHALRWAALDALLFAPPEELRPHLGTLARYIADPDEDAGLRSAAILTLRAMRGDCVACLPALRAALAEESHDLITPCLLVLTQMGARAAPAVPELLRWLREPDDRVPAATAAVLGEIGARPDLVLPALSELILKRGLDAGAKAMGTFGPAALPHAVRVLEEGDEFAQYAVLWAFATMGTKAAPVVPRLIELIDGEDADISQRAVATLGSIGAPAQSAVAAIIKRMALGEDTLKANVAGETLARLGEPAQGALMQALSSSDKTLQHQAVKAVAQFKRRGVFALDALEPLTKVEDVRLRRDAFSAVGAAVVDAGTMQGPPGDPLDKPTLLRLRALLERAMKDKDEEIRGSAKWKLAGVTWQLAQL